MASEAQHTPGPWKVEQDPTLIWCDCNPEDATSYGMGYPVAEARTHIVGSGTSFQRKVGEAEAAANARLIAAAPDMLEALHSFRADLDTIIRYAAGKDAASRRDWARGHLTKIDAVIIKATAA